MKLFTILPAFAVAALAAPIEDIEERQAAPRVWLAGDSTTALNGAGAGNQGWGPYLPYSLSGVTVNNRAIGGRSSRSYTDEGRFNTLINSVASGDIVVIEFGINDGGSLNPDNGRSVCVGSGSETCTTAAGLVVQTYVTYLTNAAKSLIAKGAKVIIASPIPRNVCQSGTCGFSPDRFTEYARQVVRNVGSGSTFINHGQYVANRFIALGATVTRSYYPVDNTHFSPQGASVVAAAFMKGVMCSNHALAAYSKNSTASIPGSCVA